MRPFILLQLSDLHFGPHSRFAGVQIDGLAARCTEAVHEAIMQLDWKARVELLLVTGDITEAARPIEYDSALAFFTALAEQLGIPRSAVVCVPGNHDVSWTQCKEVEGQLQDGLFTETEFRVRLDAVKLSRFDDMLARFYDPSPPAQRGATLEPTRPPLAGCVSALARGAHVHDFEDLNVSIAALNSCEIESHREQDHRGYISEEQAQAVLTHWAATAPTDRVRIVAVHHNPVATIPKAILDWRDWLRSQAKKHKLSKDMLTHFVSDVVGFEGHERLHAVVADAQVSLLFHGHHHASEAIHAWGWRGKLASGDTRIISAGSWSLVAKKLPAEQPVVMQLVLVDPNTLKVQPVLLRYEPRARSEGIVDLGAFVLDEVTRNHAPLKLSLRAATRVCSQNKGQSNVTSPSHHQMAAQAAAALIAAYRARKRDNFIRWDLRAVGASPSMGNSRPIEVKLDEMYVPLRMGKKHDLNDLTSGGPIDAQLLLHRKTPLVIIGNAGSGKTTWMKRTFRELIQTKAAIPFFLELRAIAATWETRPASERTIEAYLADEMKACGIAGWETALAEILGGHDQPRSVLLIDGWDELGDLGERLRTCLTEFCSAHTGAVVVVSSRPYGEARPAGSEGFEALEIQPLDDTDVRLLTHKFHRLVHGEDEAAAEKSTSDFAIRLGAVPEARALGRTALLLTMMLLLSREGPLPDKRHKLYLACMRNLLDARPALRESEGAQLRRNEWRPRDQEARLRAVSEMAYRMQSHGYESAPRGPIVRPWREASSLLPELWTQTQRDGFLLWLINSAGVLVDRSDDAISFAHLSFQEFLAAHFLFATLEGTARTEIVCSHADDMDWWETLRLWAGLIGDLSPDKLSSVFPALGKSSNTFWLVGSILADGSGQLADFDDWKQRLSGQQTRLAWSAAQYCAWAWATSKQYERRAELAEAVATSASAAHWIDGLMLAEWSTLTSISTAPSTHVREALKPIVSEIVLARSRVLTGASWWWPGHSLVTVLRLWPSARTRVSLALQTFASLERSRAMLLRVAAAIIEQARNRVLDIESHTDVVHDVGRHFVNSFIQDFGHVFGRDLGGDLVSYLLDHFGHRFARCLAAKFVFYLNPTGTDHTELGHSFRRYLGFDLNRDMGLDFARYLGQDSWNDLSAELAEAWSLDADVAGTASWRDFVLVEAASAFGRASVRAALAHRDNAGDHPDETRLIQLACQTSLGHERDRQRIVDATARYKGSPLWPAFARHIARESTHEDHALLNEIAARPEQRDPPVSWALRYYVRGDIVMRDNTVITIDELCDELDVQRLPLLEDMPAERMVNFRND